MRRVSRNRKPKHLIRGKSVREWSEIMGVKLVTAWSWFKKGTLEDHIDGAHFPQIPKRWFGLTFNEIRERLGVQSRNTVARWIRNGTLERRLKGESIPRNYPPGEIICDGKTARQIQEEIGVSRQRVHQLKDKGLLKDRLRGIDTFKQGMTKRKTETAARRESYRQARRSGESIPQLAKRIGVPYTTVKAAFSRVPFAEERRHAASK